MKRDRAERAEAPSNPAGPARQPQPGLGWSRLKRAGYEVDKVLMKPIPWVYNPGTDAIV